MLSARQVALRNKTRYLQRLSALASSGISTRVKKPCRDFVILLGPCAAWPWALVSLSASLSVTVKAITKEIAMPMLALIGIGLMYGPIRPLTKAIGNKAAITVKVARMVGLPTLSTARGMGTDSGSSGLRLRCRRMFSTTTMASSTRMPMEKMSANSETRFNVKPQAQLANRVAVSVRITAAPTMIASRRPSARPTRMITLPVAKMSFWISLLALLALLAAVWPWSQVMATSTSSGITVLRSTCRRSRTPAATSTAFSPGFLVTVIVTAAWLWPCCSGCAVSAAPGVNHTQRCGSCAPASTRATSRK